MQKQLETVKRVSGLCALIHGAKTVACYFMNWKEANISTANPLKTVTEAGPLEDQCFKSWKRNWTE